MPKFFTINIEHDNGEIQECLINLDYVTQVVIDPKLGIGKIRDIKGFVYNIGKPEIEQLMKIIELINDK